MMFRHLLLGVYLLGNFFLLGSSSNCSGRQILTGEEGSISDGVGEYDINSHCEWLIDAGGPNKTIYLTFENMATECSFDFLFVYDGNTYNSRLIATLSGDSPPRPLMAYSGYMLLYLFSDRNYKKMGFDAHYSLKDCPWDCNGRGSCKNNTCHCEMDYSGVGCQLVDCPDDCGGHGVCTLLSYKHQYCLCDVGYVGRNCSLQVAGTQGQGQWYRVREEDEEKSIPGRTSHVSVFIHDCIWVFGGFDLNHALNDLWRYCLYQNEWEIFNRELGGFLSDLDIVQNTSSPWPAARSGHAADSYHDDFFIFGGILENGSHSNELWHFNTTSLQWKVMSNESVVKPMKVTGHTLTTVDNYLYLVGGKSEERVFIDLLFRIDAQNPTQWERVLVMGGNYPPKRYVGHSTVYHKASNSLLVFGGYTQGSGLFSDRTHEIQAFNIKDKYWALLSNQNWGKESMPHDRAFHSAVIVGNYMVVYGGNTHVHSGVEICYNQEMFFYHLGCHVWVNHTFFTGSFMPQKGRFGHSATVANGNIMFIMGGYSGTVLGDLIAYKMPLAVADFKCSPGSVVCARHNSSSSFPPAVVNGVRDHCEVYNHSRSCQGDPECVYCHQGRLDASNGSCVHRERVELCKRGDFHDSKERCPGICPTLHTCGACVSQGKGVDKQVMQSVGRRGIHIKSCSWCVKEAQCQTQSEPFGTCYSAQHTESGIRGWWGGLSANLTTLSECQTEDFPSGLHWLKYKNPMNSSFPDELVIVRKTKGKMGSKKKQQIESSFNLTTLFVGFIHPLNTPTPPGENLTLELGMTNARARLYLSTNESISNKELVISSAVVLSTHKTKQAFRPSGLAIFPFMSRGHKYYLEQVTEQAAKGQETSITLMWNGMLTLPSKNSVITSRQSVITSEFLEPYSNGNCSNSYNCYGCLSDVLCGWCDTARKCVRRDNISEDLCEDNTRYLITSPAECPSCGHYVECSTCAADPLCEWELRDAHCTRRLRNTNAVTNSSHCRLPCHLRAKCAECIKEEGECAWCENTRTCLPFSEYVTRYIYGQCTSWVDDPELDPGCRLCRNYNVCGSCLQEFGCGWCSVDYNPEIGLCLDGDFAGVDGNISCGNHLTAAYNTSEQEPSSWSYDLCPDVEECLLGMHNCHANATCINTYTSFNCHCNRGFIGDGKTCDKTCYSDCVNGHCSGPQDFKCVCDLGWTNDSCDVNCGCNNRSTCYQGVGVCDACQEMTAGPYCEQCVAGAYVDPMDPEKCIRCHCNGHTDKTLGECNNATGECFCTDNTYGFHCEHCRPGYYGSPRHGGRCYLGCDHRTFLTNITTGALGSSDGSSSEPRDEVYCLWVLSAHSSFHLPDDVTSTATVVVTLESKLKVQCGMDAVYVYDGIPWFIAGVGKGNGKLLGSFCGISPEVVLSVQARSGVATIFFHAHLLTSTGTLTRGFNATYNVLACPDGCHGNQECQDGQCVCKPGFWGHGCRNVICPHNCHQDKNQGHCHNRVCICQPGLSGESCNEKPDDDSFDLQIRSDSLRAPPPWREEQNRLVTVEHRFVHFHKFIRPSSRHEMETEEEEEDDLEYTDAYGPSPRAGHTLTQCGEGLLFLYGGLSVEHMILADMWMYNTTASTWTRLIPPTSINPPGRYYHAAACIPLLKMIYVFGGFEAYQTGSVPLASLGVKANNSLWKFNIESHAWTTESSPPWLPSLAGHTLTHIGLTKLILVGGFSTENYFNEKVFEYDVSNGLIAWQQWDGTMKGAVPIGLYGHSAVFEPATDTIYVFGGYLFRSDHWFISNELFTLDIKDRSWNMLYPHINSRWGDRVFHTAVSLEDRMVVIGGMTSWGTYASTVLVYRYQCSTWHKLSFEELDIKQDTISKFGSSAAQVNGFIYLFGGFSGTSSGTLSRISLPKDLCALVFDPVVCSNLAGCQICVMTLGNGDNKTMCYSSQGKNDTQPLGCKGPSPTNKRCDERNHKHRKCSRYRTCSHCLATHPHFKEAGPSCTWCTNCPRSNCVPREQGCPDTDSCNRPKHTISSVSNCYEYLCPASDCQKCGRVGKCLWILRSSDIGGFFHELPKYPWVCVSMSLKPSTSTKFQSMPPEPCPLRCHQYKSCKSCLRSSGGEGGSLECFWSENLRECVAPAYVPLRCSQGECGYLHQGEHSTCPRPCRHFNKCADCIAAPGCGWCAFGGGNGQGVCMPGGVFAPSRGVCVEGNASVITKKVSIKPDSLPPTHHANAIWSYHQCQPENECKNQHHTCNPKTQDCFDTLEHFRCACKHGYITDKAGNCEPVCHQGCVHGVCYKPDACRCVFGWVGDNCSVECQCNKHSNCPNVTSNTVCLKCANNTMGSKCQHCKRNYVGNPENGGRCMPCWEFCNNHTATCMSQHEYDMSQLESGNVNFKYYQMVHKGPLESNAVCIDCMHNTTSHQCEQCTTGHFRRHEQSPTQPCQECHCNGHGNVCDTDTGENCKCKNNTETNCDAKEESQCWKHQCAQCKEYFLGTPTNGHQCYRQMNVDRDYCFDPNTQKNCDQVPQPLLQGRTVFFAVQPKYLNVNIRITIDVTMGSADIFLSNEKDTYQVFLDRQDYFHDILVDKMYVPNLGGLARRSAELNQPEGESTKASPPPSMDDIIVNDEAVGTVFESESVVITKEVPNFLKMRSSDTDFYKMSQFENVEELDKGEHIEENKEVKEEMKKGKDKVEVKKPKIHVGKVAGRSDQAKERARKKYEVYMKFKKKHRKRRKKKEHFHLEKLKKRLDWKLHRYSTLADIIPFLDRMEFVERLGNHSRETPDLKMVNSTHWSRRHRRGTFLYNKAFGPRRRRSEKLQVEEEEGMEEDLSRMKRQQTFQQRSRRGLTVTDAKKEGSEISNYNSDERLGIKVGEIKAGALNTYITVSQHNSVLVVRDVRFRLVVMLPRDQHDLKSSRFYIIVRSRGGNTNNSTFGNLYFRQDQPHIDLFVFFSVFFSCFFLFLSVCVMLWKLKQTFDARRSRQMREREMECMASRPFAHILVLLESEGVHNQVITSSTLVSRRCRLTRVNQNGGQYYTTTNNDLNNTISSILPPPSSRELGVVPIAIEPTDNGLAAIGTVLFQLPGGATAPARLCLGSSLTTRMVSSANSQKSGNLRRRTSASSC